MGEERKKRAENALASHIEVCCRIRPLIVSAETNSDGFFANTGTRTTSRLRKPQIPTRRTVGPSYSGSPSVSARSSPRSESAASTADPSIYAWDVVSGDTVQQSPKTDIIPGRTFQYTLDKVYGPETSTMDLYEQSVRDRVLASMHGYHAAIMAYGQTSTGKTHSMSGTGEHPGLIPLSIQTCFQYLQQESKESREYLLRVSYLEVYKEHIRDLLAASAAAPPVRLFDSTDGLVIRNLQEQVVTSAAQVFDILKQGERRRQVGATHLNQHSSRSHVMVRLWIESKGVNDNRVRVSTLSLVDLAGSESVRLTGSSERRQEGHYINQSLMTLGKVVYSLSDEKTSRKHVPYRDSKLTRLLQPSLSGQAQVVLLCCISPQVSHLEESHNTFKFAIRAKKIPQKATIQSTTGDEKTLLQSYRQEIQDLKQQLEEAKQAQEALMGATSPQLTARASATASATSPLSISSDVSLEVSENEDEISELVSAIATMEQLILKSSVPSPQETRVRTSLPEDWLDTTETSNNEDDDMNLMDLANGKSPARKSLPTPTQTPKMTPDHRDNLQNELSRIQGLLGSVLKKSRQTNNHEVESLRQQLEWQARTTDLSKADSSFLQRQLKEKDDLLLEVSQVLTALEERQQQLEEENARLKEALKIARQS